MTGIAVSVLYCGSLKDIFPLLFHSIICFLATVVIVVLPKTGESEGGLLEQRLDVLEGGQVLAVVLLDVLEVGRGQEVDERVGTSGKEAGANRIVAVNQALEPGT